MYSAVNIFSKQIKASYFGYIHSDCTAKSPLSTFTFLHTDEVYVIFYCIFEIIITSHAHMQWINEKKWPLVWKRKRRGVGEIWNLEGRKGKGKWCNYIAILQKNNTFPNKQKTYSKKESTNWTARFVKGNYAREKMEMENDNCVCVYTLRINAM